MKHLVMALAVATSMFALDSSADVWYLSPTANKALAAVQSGNMKAANKYMAALGGKALVWNKLANSIKYDHGFAVNAVYAGYHPYTTRAIKTSSYVSTAALARLQLAKIWAKLLRR